MNLVKASSLKDCAVCWHMQRAYEEMLCCKGSVIRAEAARHPKGHCQPQALNFKPTPRRIENEAAA